MWIYANCHNVFSVFSRSFFIRISERIKLKFKKYIVGVRILWERQILWVTGGPGVL